jgi:hypothetical protein
LKFDVNFTVHSRRRRFPGALKARQDLRSELQHRISSSLESLTGKPLLIAERRCGPYDASESRQRGIDQGDLI